MKNNRRQPGEKHDRRQVDVQKGGEKRKKTADSDAAVKNQGVSLVWPKGGEGRRASGVIPWINQGRGNISEERGKGGRRSLSGVPEAGAKTCSNR